MSYIATEESAEDGRPVELYLFEGGDGSSFAYTSGNVDVIYGAHTYTPVVMKRSAPTLSNKSASAKLTLTFPDDNPWAARYLQGVPPLPEVLTIFRTHLTDAASEVIHWWSGDIGAVTFKDDKALALVTTTGDRLQRTIPKRTFAWGCNHVLFDGLCKAARSSVRSDVIIASILSTDRRWITVTDDPAWAPAPPGATMTDRLLTGSAPDIDFFNGGYIEPKGGGGQVRSILKTTSTSGIQFKLMVEVPDLTPGDIMSIYGGCDHSVQTCKAKFDNVNNYGGFPFIPTKNPFATGIISEGE